MVLPTGARTVKSWSPVRRDWVINLGLLFVGAAVSIELGHSIARGSTRMASLVLVVLGSAVVAQFGERAALMLLLAVAAFPLYSQGLHLSLTVPLTVGVWIAYLASRRSREAVGSESYAAPLFAIGVTSLIAAGRGMPVGAEAGALGKLVVGLAIFTACLVMLRTEPQIRSALKALCVGEAIVFLITMLQLLAPGFHLPGMIATGGTVQQNLYGIGSNLRLGGPIGDYELLAEFFALTGAIGVFIGLRTPGWRSWLWLACLPMAVIGIATTSTRSGLVVLAVGVLAAVVLSGRIRVRGRLLVGLLVALGIVPLLSTLEARFGTGYLFARVSATEYHGGLLSLLDRGSVWPYIAHRLPHGVNLVFGRTLSYDYSAFGTWPHSLPLTLFATVGIAGAVAFYWLLGLIAFRGARAARERRSQYAALAPLLIGLFALDEVKIEYLRQPNYQWFIWGMLGVCAAATRVRTSEVMGGE